jgi:hypothetical protein
VTLTYEQLEQRIESAGLAARGGFHPAPGDALGDVRTVILVGFTRNQHWAAFANSPEYRDGRADPLDRWSKRIIDVMAAEVGGRALYPSDGPPWWPFQSWARRALALHVSPLGVLIDPRFGLWHSYRGALALTTGVALPDPVQWSSPCDSCTSRPCLHACPVGAVRTGAFDVDGCRAQVRAVASGCRTLGCVARRACPIGAEYAYPPAQAQFYMNAFTPRGD